MALITGQNASGGIQQLVFLATDLSITENARETVLLASRAPYKPGNCSNLTILRTLISSLSMTSDSNVAPTSVRQQMSGLPKTHFVSRERRD